MCVDNANNATDEVANNAKGNAKNDMNKDATEA